MVHDRDSLGIVDRVHIMVDISDDTEIVRRRAQVTGVVRRRRWSDEEKGRIVAEPIAPDAVISDVAWRYNVAPQHLSNWIRADGRFALPADGMPAFVPVVSIKSTQASKAVCLPLFLDQCFVTRCADLRGTVESFAC